MKKLVSGFTLLLIALGLQAQQPKTAAGTTQNTAPVVRTSAGIVRGTTEGDVESFKGIPYAAPPVGEFRWRPPQPVAAWQGELDATKFGANCAQAGWGGAPGSIAQGSSEDCLFLNLWKPAGAKPEQNCLLWYGSMVALSLEAAGKIQEISLPNRESS